MSESRRRKHNAGSRVLSDNVEFSHRNQRGWEGGAVPPPLQGRRNVSSSQNNVKQSLYQRMNNYDRVRKIVQEEGRTARNLVNYNLPLEKSAERIGRAPTRRLRKSPKLRSVSVSAKDKILNGSTTSLKSFQDSPKLDCNSRKADLRARYWAFLFDNLQRAVDAVYETCEQDESVLECKEVIMMLEQGTKDFKSLIERLNLLRAYENATKEGDRPVSIAWEVRKMSPGKNASRSPMQEHSSPCSAQRALNFGTSNTPQPPTKLLPGNSWADRVKGTTSSPPVVVIADSVEIKDVEEMDGWEIVHRGGKSKSRNSNFNRMDKSQNLNSGSRSDKFFSRRKTDRNYENRQRNNVVHHSTESVKSQSSAGAKMYQDKKPQATSQDKNLRTNCADNQNVPSCSGAEKKLQAELPESHVGKKSQNTCVDDKPQPAPVSLDIAKDVKSEPPDKKPHVALDKNKQNESRTRERLDSAESEKENIPVEEISLKMSYWDGDMGEKVAFNKALDIESLDCELDNCDTSAVLDESEKENLEEDEEEVYAEQIENALATACDEEEALTSQLEQEQKQALESAIQEENWLQELAREESMHLDAETEIELEMETETTADSLDTSKSLLDWDSLVAAYDAEEETRKSKSWGELVDEAESRTPGHGVHMHEKLSSPSRKKSPTEFKKRHEEKQAKAQELREKLRQEKADRLKEISRKVEEVHAWKEELLIQRKATMERKLQRAEEKRHLQLKLKAQKAHEEEAKANEIAFINALEAQNKRHDILSKHQEFEARLQDIQEERQRRLEEKLAKEAAVEERRKALELERKVRLQEMQEKRKQRDARVEQNLQEREKERLEAVRAKEKDREERLAALNAQQQAHIQELQKKIQQKQDESTQRHQVILKQIREKAFEMSVLHHSTEDHNEAPQMTPYVQKKFCTACNVLILSEVYLLSHLRGKKHQEAIQENSFGKTLSKEEIESFNLRHIVDAPDQSTNPQIASEKERQKALKKRCKKLRQRMSVRGIEYENSIAGKQKMAESEHKAKLQKIVKDINKYLQCSDSGPWSQNRVSALERALNEISRILEKKVPSEQTSFRVLGGLTTLSKLLNVIDISANSVAPVIPTKSLVITCGVIRQACKGYYENCHYMLFSNKIGVLIDLLIHQLTFIIPDNTNLATGNSNPDKQNSDVQPKLRIDPLAVALTQLISSILSCLAKNNPLTNSSEASAERMSSSGDTFMNRRNDVISFFISVGIVDKLTQFFSSIQGPIDAVKEVADFLQHSLGMLVALTKFLSKRNANVFEDKVDDPSQLIVTFRVTELVGIVSLLYGMLLHSGAPSRGDVAPPHLPLHTITVTTMGLRMLNHMATLDLHMVQKCLGEEGMSLEFRHIASYLIWYCSHHSCEELFHEVILCVGYFTVQNADNQTVIQSGQAPTILQQLCALPFQYFSDPRLTNVLFPTLVACCYNNQSNKDILEQELSSALLANFVEEKQLECQQARLLPTSVKKTKAQDKDKSRDGDVRMTLAARFPADLWAAAGQYFKVA